MTLKFDNVESAVVNLSLITNRRLVRSHSQPHGFTHMGLTPIRPCRPFRDGPFNIRGAGWDFLEKKYLVSLQERKK